MSSSAQAKYYPRSPRYVFRPEDRSLLRFAAMETKGIATHARVRDLSTTGISFFVNSVEAPFEGELLKIEFGLPGATQSKNDQVAWFATVVRVEERSEWDPEIGDRSLTLVALKFDRLPDALIQTLKQSLRDRAKDQDSDYSVLSQVSAKQILTFSLGSFALVLAMVFMSLPPNVWLYPFRPLFFKSESSVP